jgi:protein gp37
MIISGDDDLRDACQAMHVPFFFKQWGGVNRKKTGRLLDGKTYDEMPILHLAFQTH